MARARATEPSPGSTWAPAAALSGAAAYGVGLLVADPFKAQVVGCPIHRITGGWCPGCGSSRAVDVLLHGDVLSSLSYNVLVLPALLALAWWWTGWALEVWTGARPRWAPSPTTLPAWIPLAVGAGVVAFAVARNLAPFAWLAP